MKRESFAEIVSALLVSSSAGLVLLLSSCENGGGGSGPSGKSTVQGTIIAFSTDTALFLPASQPAGVKRLFAALSEIAVPSAHAAGMGGVGVRIVGTDHQTTSADDGFFIMSGVPGGNYRMQLSFNGTNAYMQISVPDDGTLYVSDIQCRGSQAYSDRMYSMMNDAMHSASMMDNNQQKQNHSTMWNR